MAVSLLPGGFQEPRQIACRKSLREWPFNAKSQGRGALAFGYNPWVSRFRYRDSSGGVGTRTCDWQVIKASGNLSFHGFPTICLTRWQPRTGFTGKVRAATNCRPSLKKPRILGTHFLGPTRGCRAPRPCEDIAANDIPPQPLTDWPEKSVVETGWNSGGGRLTGLQREVKIGGLESPPRIPPARTR